MPTLGKEIKKTGKEIRRGIPANWNKRIDQTVGDIKKEVKNIRQTMNVRAERGKIMIFGKKKVKGKK